MTRYTYKVIPAPAKGRKAPGIKGAGARFAHGLEEAMNEMAAQGWEYLRADILPSEERHGLASTHTVYRSVLVFRRAVDMAEAEPPARPAPTLTATSPGDAEPATPDGDDVPETATAAVASGRGTPHLRAVDADAPETDIADGDDTEETGDVRTQADDNDEGGPRQGS